MKKFKSISIRNNLITLIIIMVVIPFTVIVYSLLLERNRQVDDTVHKTAVQVEQTAKLINQLTGSTELILNMLSRLPIVQSGDETVVNRFLLDLVSQYPEYSSLFIVDTTGRRWATTNQMTGDISYSDRKYFVNAISSGRFSSGEYAIGKVKKKPVFSFALPVRNSYESIASVAVATVELSGLKKLLQKQITKDDFSVIVIDHKGKILLHSVHTELEGTQLDEAVFRQMRQVTEAEVFETGSPSNTSSKIISYEPLAKVYATT